MIPVQSNLFVPILKVLSENPWGVKARDVYARVVQFYPELSEQELQKTVHDSRDNKVYNHLRWARLKLVTRGFMVKNSAKGLWQMSSKGKKFLKDNEPTWRAEYTEQTVAS